MDNYITYSIALLIPVALSVGAAATTKYLTRRESSLWWLPVVILGVVLSISPSVVETAQYESRNRRQAVAGLLSASWKKFRTCTRECDFEKVVSEISGVVSVQKVMGPECQMDGKEKLTDWCGPIWLIDVEMGARLTKDEWLIGSPGLRLLVPSEYVSLAPPPAFATE